MRIISGQDIRQNVPPDVIIQSVKSAFRMQEAGGYVMPDRSHIFHGDNVYLLMPCLVPEFIGTKLVSVFPENPAISLPAIHGLMILMDEQTGKPLALLDGSVLTEVRTGAVGAVGLDCLAEADLHTLGVVGAGVQGLSLARFMCTVRPIDRVCVFDREQERAVAFKAKLTMDFPGVSVHVATRVAQLLEQSRAIVTATTSMKPVLPERPELLMGRILVGIGSYRPDMTELPGSLFSLLSQVFVDTPFAAAESGDLSMRLDTGLLRDQQLVPLGKLLTGEVERAESDTHLFKSVGMALFDVMVAGAVLQLAVENDFGTEIEI